MRLRISNIRRGRTFLHWCANVLGVSAAQSQTTYAERDAIARHASTARIVAELGVYEGVTSSILKASMPPDGKLYLIDPFSPGKLGFSYQFSITKKQLRATPGKASVVFIRKLSWEASIDWIDPIDLLFIDADHSFEAVYRDWKEWSHFVRKGGKVGLHDSRVHPGMSPTEDWGPVKLVREVISRDPCFVLAEEVHTLSVFERVG